MRMSATILDSRRHMEHRYRRTPSGDKEIATRNQALDRRARTVLIVLGKGKDLSELTRELRLLPTELEKILAALIEQGLIARGSEDGTEPVSQARPVGDTPTREAQRYFTYLIGIVGNADSSLSLALTIALKRADTPEALAAVGALFHNSLEKIVGADEARRLMGKVHAYQ
jgi:hypothetical protein